MEATSTEPIPTSFAPPALDAELAYIFEVPDWDPEIDEELTAALEPIDD
jgi:hypothetical protein